MLALVVLASCSSKPQEVLSVEVVPQKIERPKARQALPNPVPIKQLPVHWTVITPDKLPKGSNWVFYGITPKGYESLARNQADTTRFVSEAMWRLRYYRGEVRSDALPPDHERPDNG